MLLVMVMVFLLQKVQEGIQSSFASLKGQLLSEINNKIGSADSASYDNDGIEGNDDYVDEFENDLIQFDSYAQSNQPYADRFQHSPGMVEEGRLAQEYLQPGSLSTPSTRPVVLCLP